MTEPDRSSLGADLLDGAVDDAPDVVAVVAARGRTDHLEETLESLVGQDYPRLSILVVDATPDPIADRVASVAPDAFLHRLTGAPTTGAAFNQGASLVDGAPLLLLCADDVVLEPDAVTQLVVGLYRANAGVVTPKVVRLDDRRRLRQIGMGADRFGVAVDLVDPDEFDQDQYDSQRDVFVAPLGVQLIRADLFATLDGFDTAVDAEAIDVDLSWRAQLLGARVVAIPRAKVAAADPEASPDVRRRDLTRQRLRTVLTTSSLLRVAPIAVGLIVLEALYCLLAGRRRQATGVLSALPWNIARWGETQRRRKRLAALRDETGSTVTDRQLQKRQVGGSARIAHYFRHQLGSGQDRVTGVVSSLRTSVEDRGVSSARVGVLGGALVAFVMIFGSRHLLTRGVSFVGQMPVLPADGVLLGEWWGSWRSAQLGLPSASPTAYAAVGLAQEVVWSDSLLELLLVVIPIVTGVVGAWTLVRPLGSASASAAASAAYAFNPLLSAILSAGRWDALILWGAAPTLLGSVLRLQGLTPYGGDDAGPGVQRRRVPVRLLRLAVATTATVTFVPGAVVLTLFLIAAVAVASLVTLRLGGLVRLALGAVLAVAAPVVLHGPWGFQMLGQGRVDWLLGSPSPLESFDSMADLVRFAPSSPAPASTALGLTVVALVGLAIGRASRFDLAVTGWCAALGSFVALWLARRASASSGLDTEAVLVIAAVGLALAAGAAVRSMELDGRSRPSRVIGVVGLVGLAVLGVGAVRNALDGNWGGPQQGYEPIVGALVDETASSNRTLWLAAEEIAPFDTVATPGGLRFAVIDQGAPDLRNRWAPAEIGGLPRIGEQLDLAVAGDTVHLGRLLALWGIDTVVYLPQLVPYEGAVFTPGVADPIAVLDAQVDLRRVTGVPGLVVYDNRPSAGVAAAADGLSDLTPDPRSVLAFDVETLQPVAATRIDVDRWELPADLETAVLAVPAEGWSADGAEISTAASGLLSVAGSSSGDPIVVAHPLGWGRRLWLIAQLLAMTAAVLLAQTRPEGRAEETP
ncbi:MAG: glycosyltransferase family 2 protein [Acidimicrobiales bacterium]